MDCSSFAASVYYTVTGAHIGSNTGDESAAGIPIDITNAQAGDDTGLEPGDLIFFDWGNDNDSPPDHVAIYVGGGYVVNEHEPGEGVEEYDLFSPGYAPNYQSIVKIERYITIDANGNACVEGATGTTVLQPPPSTVVQNPNQSQIQAIETDIQTWLTNLGNLVQNVKNNLVDLASSDYQNILQGINADLNS